MSGFFGKDFQKAEDLRQTIFEKVFSNATRSNRTLLREGAIGKDFQKAEASLFLGNVFYLLYHRISFQNQALLVFAKEVAQLPFVMAELFLAMGTGEAFIRSLVKALGMQPCGKLPNEQKEKRNAEKPPRVIMRNKDQRREHHGVIPIIDAAAATAFILHKPGLEGAEEENADHIADRIEEADQKENSLVDPMEEIRRADRAVEPKPSESHRRR